MSLGNRITALLSKDVLTGDNLSKWKSSNKDTSKPKEKDSKKPRRQKSKSIAKIAKEIVSIATVGDTGRETVQPILLN